MQNIEEDILFFVEFIFPFFPLVNYDDIKKSCCNSSILRKFIDSSLKSIFSPLIESSEETKESREVQSGLNNIPILLISIAIEDVHDSEVLCLSYSPLEIKEFGKGRGLALFVSDIKNVDNLGIVESEPLCKQLYRHLDFFTFRISDPLESLQRVLLSFFIPLCAEKDFFLRSHIQELRDAIAEREQQWPPFFLVNVTHPVLWRLLIENPQATDIEFFTSRLQEKLADTVFIRDVQRIWQEGVSLLTNINIYSSSVVSLALEMQYWECGKTWISDILSKFNSLPWLLLRHILENRIDRSIEKHILHLSKLITDHLSFLQQIPFHELIGKDEAPKFIYCSLDIIRSFAYPCQYPEKRKAVLYNVVGAFIIDRLYEIYYERYKLMNYQECQKIYSLLNDLLYDTESLFKRYEETLNLVFQSKKGPKSNILSSNETSNYLRQQILDTTADEDNLIRLVTSKEVLHNIIQSVKKLRLMGLTYQEIYSAVEKFSSDYKHVFIGLLDEMWLSFLRLLDQALFQKISLFDNDSENVLLSEYNNLLSRLDNAISILFEEKFSYALTNYRKRHEIYQNVLFIYKEYLPIPTVKVQKLLDKYRITLLNIFQDEIEITKHQFFNSGTSNGEVNTISKLLKMPFPVALILFEVDTESRMRLLLNQHDILFENGWRSFLNHQNGLSWVLSQNLVNQLGLSCDDLPFFPENVGSEIYGAALILVFLELWYPRSREDWSVHPNIKRIKFIFSESLANVLDEVKGSLQRLVPEKNPLNTKENIPYIKQDAILHGMRKRIDDHVVNWAKGVIQDFLLFGVDIYKPFKVKSHVFFIDKNTKYENRLCISINLPSRWHEFINSWTCLVNYNFFNLPEFAKVDSFLRSHDIIWGLGFDLENLLTRYEMLMKNHEVMFSALMPEEFFCLHSCLLDFSSLHWDNESLLNEFMLLFSKSLNQLTVGASSLGYLTTQITESLENLSQISIPTKGSFSHELKKISLLINELSFRTLNVGSWIQLQYPLMIRVLSRRLENHIALWLEEFNSLSTSLLNDGNSPSTKIFGLQPLYVLARADANYVGFDSHPIQWRAFWIDKWNKSLGWLSEISLIFTNYQSPSAEYLSNSEETWNVFSKSTQYVLEIVLSQCSSSMLKPLLKIEQTITKAMSVYDSWLSAQRLLQVPIKSVVNSLGQDLAAWRKELVKMTSLYSVILNSINQEVNLGSIRISSRDACFYLNSHIRQRTDRLHIEFHEVFQKNLEPLLSSLSRVSEDQTIKLILMIDENKDIILLEGDLLRNIIVFLTKYEGYQKQLQDDELTLVSVESSADYFMKFSNFAYTNTSQVSDIRNLFNLTLSKIEECKGKVNHMHSELLVAIEKYSEKLEVKVTILQTELGEIESSLESSLQRGDFVYDTQQIQTFLKSTKEIIEDEKFLHQAQYALGMTPSVENPIKSLSYNVQSFEKLWQVLKIIYSQLRETFQLDFFTISPSALETKLGAIKSQLTDSPDDSKHFSLFNQLIRVTELYYQRIAIVKLLRSDAMSSTDRTENHWRSLISAIGVKWNLHNLSLGMVITTRLEDKKDVIAKICDLAEGELRIEHYLYHLANEWQEYNFPVMFYRNIVYLFTDISKIEEKITDDLGSISRIKNNIYGQSPSIVALRGEWEKNLESIFNALKAVTELQGKWIYLETIFRSSGKGITTILAKESHSFELLSVKFFQLMPKSSQKLMIPIDFFLRCPNGINNWITSIERISNHLNAIQKSLGRYLENQRQDFSRFFFVGDEDLIQTIGSGDDPQNAFLHLSKMFFALNRVHIEFPNKINDSGSIMESSDSPSTKSPVITHFESINGESIFLTERSIILSGNCTQKWIYYLEQAMISVIRDAIPKAYQTVWNCFDFSRILDNSKSQESVSLRNGHLLAGEDHSASEDVSEYDHVSFLLSWINDIPCQVAYLAMQISWVTLQENAFSKRVLPINYSLRNLQPKEVAQIMEGLLSNLAACVVFKSGANTSKGLVRKNYILCKKIEILATLLVYQRDVSRKIASSNVYDSDDFFWLSVIRIYLNNFDNSLSGKYSVNESESEKVSVVCRIVDATFPYTYEYLGLHERIICTPLTEKCFLTLTQALHHKLGGSPCGPAGTGKTETVKALAMQFGRMFLVFNCDKSFDSRVMERILIGLCELGGWGCFDEFNRLHEEILSSVSQYIALIQKNLRLESLQFEWPNRRKINLHPNVGLFVTMNPDYAGRSALPDNLKKTFRSVTMSSPDKQKIAEVLFFAQGFQLAENLACKIVLLFDILSEKLSKQQYYDFSLRALKAALITASELLIHQGNSDGKIKFSENEIIIQSLILLFIPKLIKEDVFIFYDVLNDIFSKHKLDMNSNSEFTDTMNTVLKIRNLDNILAWHEKIIQLYETLHIRHGVMLVGSSGTGKTECWRTLLHITSLFHRTPMEAYVISPKAQSKEKLFGYIDSVTNEWVDGVFTSILRRILIKIDENSKNISSKMSLDRSSNLLISHSTIFPRYWIIFDGEIEPSWVENLNSVLDDNHVFTLCNGERLPFYPEICIIFEVENIKLATPATISRCGILRFDDEMIPTSSLIKNKAIQFLKQMETTMQTDLPLNGSRLTVDPTGFLEMVNKNKGNLVWLESSQGNQEMLCKESKLDSSLPDNLPSSKFIDAFLALLLESGDVANHIETLYKQFFNLKKPLPISFSLINIIQGFLSLWIFPFFLSTHSNVSELSSIHCFRQYHFSTLWSYLSFLPDTAKEEFLELYLINSVRWREYLPESNEKSVLDFFVSTHDGEWKEYSASAALQSNDFSDDMIDKSINDELFSCPAITVDFAQYSNILDTWIRLKLPAILLCGPPSSGKSLLFNWIIKKKTQFQVISISFTTATTSDLIIQLLEQQCIIEKHPLGGLIMHGTSKRHIVLFCDGIHLSKRDIYGTSMIFEFLRQLVELKGFYRVSDNTWVSIPNISLVLNLRLYISCTVEEIIPLRLLRWMVVLYIDTPSFESLVEIYSEPCGQILNQSSKTLSADRSNQSLNPTCSSSELTPKIFSGVLVKIYNGIRVYFSNYPQSQYNYSLCDLSKWIFRILNRFNESLLFQNSKAEKYLCSLVLYEGISVFADRITNRFDYNNILLILINGLNSIFPYAELSGNEEEFTHFSRIPSLEYNAGRVAHLPITSQNFQPYPFDNIVDILSSKATLFSSAVKQGQFIFLKELLGKILRMHNVLSAPMGHVLLLGQSGVGKTSLIRFILWMSGIESLWIPHSKNNSVKIFLEDIKIPLITAGCEGKDACIVIDDAHLIDSDILEVINELIEQKNLSRIFIEDFWRNILPNLREGIRKNRGDYDQKYQDIFTESEAINEDVNSELKKVFTQRLRSHLKFILIMNANNHILTTTTSCERKSRPLDSVSLLLNTHPAFLYLCSIVWLQEWSSESLLLVARELLKRRFFVSPFLADVFFKSASEETMLEHPKLLQLASEGSVKIYEMLKFRISTNYANRESADNLKSKVSNNFPLFSPHSYIDFLIILQDVIHKKYTKSMNYIGHLKSGIKKLNDTNDAVEYQQQLLLKKEIVLGERAESTQKMLDHIIKETERLKSSQLLAQDIQDTLEEESKKTSDDQALVQRQLSEVEPALREAEASLNTISPENLREIRAYTTPPPMIQKVLEAVLLLMGEKNSHQWDAIKSVIRREDFLSFLKAFQPANSTREARNRIRNQMLSDESFSYENAVRASKAAGPLYKWVVAQVRYGDMILQVAPLRDEVESLQKILEAKEQRLNTVRAEIRSNERELKQLKCEYQDASEMTTSIRIEVTRVRKRCEMAKALLANLASERARWQISLESSEKQTDPHRIVCESLLDASIVTYFGSFDENFRNGNLIPSLFECLEITNCSVENDSLIVEKTQSSGSHWNIVHDLATNEQLALWTDPLQKLSQDHFTLENMVILSHYFSRYPIIIDPDMQFLPFIVNQLNPKSLICTSALSSNLNKEVSKALQFGYPIIIEDIEHLDSSLFLLLTHQYTEKNGRFYLKIGRSEVEVAPKNFSLFLVTRENNLQCLSLDLRERSNIVNFAVTPSSLKEKCLLHLLNHELPHIAEEREIKLAQHGVKEIRLRHLEEELLNKISKFEGQLLDHDNIVEDIACLKSDISVLEAGILSDKESMGNIIVAEELFSPLSCHIAGLYFKILALSDLHSSYTFSLALFLKKLLKSLRNVGDLNIINNKTYEKQPESNLNTSCEERNSAEISIRTEIDKQKLTNSSLDNLKSHSARFAIIANSLFNVIWDSLSCRIFKKDREVVSIYIAQIYLSWPSSLRNSSALEALDSTESDKRFADGILLSILGIKSQKHDTSPLLNTPEAFKISNILRQFIDRSFMSNIPGFINILEKYTIMMELKNAFLDSINIEQWNKIFTHLKSSELFPELIPSKGQKGDSLENNILRSFFIVVLTQYFFPFSFSLACEYFLQMVLNVLDNDKYLSLKSDIEGSPHENIVFDHTIGTLTNILPELSPTVPLLLSCSSGIDDEKFISEVFTSSNLDHSQELITHAMGASDTYIDISKSIQLNGFKEGHWILLQNIHLAPDFLISLEKLLQSAEFDEQQINSKFRLFLSGSISCTTEIPRNLRFRCSYIVMEAPTGLRHSLLRYLGLINPGRLSSKPSEISRIYLSAACFHFVVTERKQYIPYGWFNDYDFSEVLFSRLLDTIDKIIQMSFESNDQDFSPIKIRWNIIVELIMNTLYGSIVEVDSDKKRLYVISSYFFSSNIFSEKFSPILSSIYENRLPKVSFPSICSTPQENIDKWIKWVDNLSINEPTQWVALSVDEISKVWLVSTEHTKEQYIRLGSQFLSLHDDHKAEMQIKNMNQSFRSRNTKENEENISKLQEELSLLVSHFLTDGTDKKFYLNPLLLWLSDEIREFNSRDWLSLFEKDNTTIHSLEENFDWAKIAIDQLKFILSDISEWLSNYETVNSVDGGNKLIIQFSDSISLKYIFFPSKFFFAYQQHIARCYNTTLDKLSLFGSLVPKDYQIASEGRCPPFVSKNAVCLCEVFLFHAIVLSADSSEREPSIEILATMSDSAYSYSSERRETVPLNLWIWWEPSLSIFQQTPRLSISLYHTFMNSPVLLKIPVFTKCDIPSYLLDLKEPYLTISSNLL